MRTSDEREADFIADLELLLKRHGAELSVGDDGGGYGMHHGEVTISMDGVWVDGELKADFHEFTLPAWMDGANSD